MHLHYHHHYQGALKVPERQGDLGGWLNNDSNSAPSSGANEHAEAVEGL
jgi:hypothetical protein